LDTDCPGGPGKVGADAAELAGNEGGGYEGYGRGGCPIGTEETDGNVAEGPLPGS
jgi:hypothetical protein